MAKNHKSALASKIDQGLDLTRKRLIASKKQSGGSLVFQKDGAIVKVKATEL